MLGEIGNSLVTDVIDFVNPNDLKYESSSDEFSEAESA